MSVWQIYAAGSHHHEVHDSLPDLKELTATTTGKSFRRIGRFIQLALIGAARCTQQQIPAPDTAIYLSSGRGDLEVTLEILTQLYQHGQTPKPLQFVNTVSNAACFYLAQHLQLKSRSNFICNRYSAFESALQLALLDLKSGIVSSALVGSVDIATQPLADHRQRLGLAEHNAVGEGSHWLWLGVADAQRPHLGTVVAARHFIDQESLINWILQQPLRGDYCLSAGQFLAATDLAQLIAVTHPASVVEHSPQHSYYDSQSGLVIHKFLSTAVRGQQLLHINSDLEQRYDIVLIQA